MRGRIEKHLATFKRQPIPRNRRRAATVNLLIGHDEGKPAVIVTRRSALLRAHSRQWALPGGRRDAGETVVEAGLRELHEEVGLEASESDVLGLLDDFATRSGYVISPMVVWTDREWRELEANPGEVDLIKPFHFSELARDDSPVLQPIEESDQPVLSMNFHADRIFAPTAAMLYQFREVAMFGRPTRVAHFEQPLFAWK